MNLYWVNSLDHGEDWFVAAHNSKEAIGFFADDSGYDAIDDEISALLVCEILKDAAPREVEWANQELIEACGGEIKPFDDHDIKMHMDTSDIEALDATTRVVLIKNTIYVEGSVVRAALQSLKSQAI